jgi:WD40 repeat protein
MIVTGGADGLVKQYEIYRRKREVSTEDTSGKIFGPSWNLEHWPRLPTQRMKRHAHLFKGHYGIVTALVSQNGSKILSAGSDGTLRVWESSTGEELYRMDGFKGSISSVCLDREILVTDGMGELVCVHDFDIDVDEYLQAYDLDW